MSPLRGLDSQVTMMVVGLLVNQMTESDRQCWGIRALWTRRGYPRINASSSTPCPRLRRPNRPFPVLSNEHVH